MNSPITEFDPNIISRELNYSLPQLNNGLSYTTYAWATEPLRIKNFWKERLIRNNNFDKINKYNDVIVGYKLFDYKKNKNKIETLIFKNKDNDEIIVKADFFIFCMGGIENARFAKRIFKNSKIKNKEIIGNFQEHPHFYNIAFLIRGKIITSFTNSKGETF